MTAMLYDNPSARDLFSMLPLDLTIEDFGQEREDRPSAAQADRRRQRTLWKRAAGRSLLFQAMGQPRPFLRGLSMGRPGQTRPFRQQLRRASRARRVPGQYRTDMTDLPSPAVRGLEP
jgi:hypothetical protein